MTRQETLLQTPSGLKQTDSSGSPVAAARMDPDQGYEPVLNLIQDYINAGSETVWQEIRRRIDNVYLTVRSALNSLEKETAFMAGVKAQLNQGKRLFFKPNLVALPSIDPVTHGPNLPGCCSQWEFQAAVMRWFHQDQGISYYRMTIGEAANFVPAAVKDTAKVWGEDLTDQALMEGRQGNHYGGWGFYFTRRYLYECRFPGDSEDPRRGYEDSLRGHSLPPGTVDDRLLLYDINTIAADFSDGRWIQVADGINFKSILLHKVITGGDSDDPEDCRKWPGCVLINVAKLKIHMAELFTGCLKNLGIGLYPMRALKEDYRNEHDWLYGLPRFSTPCYKLVLPHTRWEPEYDPDTLEPVLDENSRPLYRKTGGIEASISDLLRALQEAGVTCVHIADAIMCTNINHSWPGSISLPEGLVLAGLDPVALDTAAARYLFSMVPMEETARIMAEQGLKSDVIQKTPLPHIEGKNIVTGEGFDSAFSRYGTLLHCENRGLGRQRFYLTGTDLWQGGRLASVDQRLGRVEGNHFTEILTRNLYHTPGKYLLDWQAMSLAYLKANDSLSGSDFYRQLLDARDDNSDGVIDYLEGGQVPLSAIMTVEKGILYEGLDPGDRLKINFLLSTTVSRRLRKEWNEQDLEIGKHTFISGSIELAYAMSRDPEVHEHPMIPGRSYGGGMWPSVQYVIHRLEFARLYGPSYPERIDPTSPFGLAFQYADLRFNGASYFQAAQAAPGADVVGTYKNAVKNGAAPLPFTFFVPTNMGRDWFGNLLNVEETADRAKMFTAVFGSGETWDRLHISEFVH